MFNKELAEELHEPIIRKFQKRKVHSFLIDNIFSADIADSQLKSKFNKGIRCLLCVIDIFGKYTWLLLWKMNKVLQLLMLFKKSWMDLSTNQTIYGQIKAVNFTVGKK